jgi:phosphatidate phosphatase LPIN
VDISLCGPNFDGTAPDAEERFNAGRVSFKIFDRDPWATINNPRLVVRIESNYYNWSTAGPLLLSLLVFKQPISDANIVPPEPARVINYRKSLYLSSEQL